MAIFQTFKGLNIKYSHRTPKCHDVIWCVLRKNHFRGVGCSLIEDPHPKKNERKTSHIKRHVKIRYLGHRNPILHAGCRPWRNRACQFWWRLVKGFGVARGQILAFYLLRCLYNTLALPSVWLNQPWYIIRPRALLCAPVHIQQRPKHVFYHRWNFYDKTGNCFGRPAF